MTCSDFGKNYLLYHYGELPSPDAEEFRAHIKDCPVCRARYDEVERLLSACASLPEPVPAASVTAGAKERLEAALSAEDRRPTGSPLRNRLKSAMRVAAAVLVFAGLAALLTNLPGPEPGAGGQGSGAEAGDFEDSDILYYRAAEYSAYLTEAWSSEDAVITSTDDEPGLIEREIEMIEEILAAVPNGNS